MYLRAHHLVASLLVGAIICGSFAWLTVNPQSAQAACATGAGVVIITPGTTSTGSLSGVYNLQAQSNPTGATGLSFMIVSPSTQAIGEANQSGSNSTWNLSWDTRNVPNGPYQIMAVAHFSGVPTADCASNALPVSIVNNGTQTPTLSTTINPGSWQGPAGVTVPFSADALYIDQYGRPSHVTPDSVKWTLSPAGIGSFSPNIGDPGVFTAGPAAGMGSVMPVVTYKGLTAEANAQIKILASGTAGPTTGSGQTPKPSPSPSPLPPSSGNQTSPAVSTADASRLAAMPTIFRPASPTNSDPIVTIPTLSCLEKAVGTVRFSQISNGSSQPSAAERKLSTDCFSGPEQIPSVLAPISPTHLTELPTTNDLVSLGSITNHVITSKDGKKVNGLLLSGTGAPNTDVFLYFFSDPLVLRAQTDAEGKWSYVLENPLKAGHHEVYAVAEKDAGNFVRTSAVPITVASAASGNADGSLIVEGKWSAAQIGFAAAAIAMIIASLIILWVIIRRRRHPKESQHLASMPARPAATSPVATLIQPNHSIVAAPSDPAPSTSAEHSGEDTPIAPSNKAVDNKEPKSEESIPGPVPPTLSSSSQVDKNLSSEPMQKPASNDIQT